MKNITLDFETYTKELNNADFTGYERGLKIACDTIRELLSNERNLMHFDAENWDIKIIDDLISALNHTGKHKELKNPLYNLGDE
jgi:hypothetical protein